MCVFSILLTDIQRQKRAREIESESECEREKNKGKEKENKLNQKNGGATLGQTKQIQIRSALFR